jgi:hypothetical protein
MGKNSNLKITILASIYSIFGTLEALFLLLKLIKYFPTPF